MGPYVIGFLLSSKRISYARLPGTLIALLNEVGSAWRSSIQKLHRNYIQVQLIQRVEYTCQGCLVSQLTFQYRDSRTRFIRFNLDRHASDKIRHGWINPALDNDLVGGRAIEWDGFPEWQTLHKLMITNLQTVQIPFLM
jgi:hypothetical protein